MRRDTDVKPRWRLLAALLVLVLAANAQAMERRIPPPSDDDWELVWGDEFSIAGLPDLARWDYDLGFERNQEPQYYTANRRENARVEGGRLIIEARRERMPNAAHRPGSASWKTNRPYADFSSASLKARDLKAWCYGRVEIRARLPETWGSWPTFWLLGYRIPWPACGEIDILEAYGADPGRNHGTLHYEVDGRHATSTATVVVPMPGEFHVYAVDWDAELIEFMLDGHVYHRFRLDEAGEGPENPFRHPLTLYLNLALRTDANGELPADALPARFEVDYVRIWQRR